MIAQIELNLAEGERRRDEGMAKSAAHAEREAPTWLERALGFVRQHPDREFMAEDIRARAYAAGLPKPPSERAWGAVMTAARQAGLIEFARFGLVRNAKAHRTPAAIWRRI